MLADEIDQLILKVDPLFFGDGTSLFQAPYSPRAFTLVENKAFESGVIIARYDRAETS